MVDGELVGVALMAAGPAVALCCTGVEASIGDGMARAEAERRAGHPGRVVRVGAQAHARAPRGEVLCSALCLSMRGKGERKREGRKEKGKKE